MKTKFKFSITALFFFLPSLAFAGEAATLNGANTAWILTSTALVLFMTLPGLALFYGGLVGTRNVLSVLMQCFSITAIISVLWMVFLYSLAFAEGNSFVGGFEKAFLVGIGPETLAGDIPEILFFVFQMTFAIITPALIVGSFAERMKFGPMLAFSALWTIIVYAPVTHWVWGGGWLQEMGLLDFAGGTVVHITAGISALVAALVIGKRQGFPKSVRPPHNLTMTVTGAGMLWVGWFGFNGGSALAANGSAAMAITVTHLSAAAGCISWSFMEWKRFGKPSVLGIVTGMVAGLGTITPAAGSVSPAGALVIGLIAGVVCFYATQLIKVKLKIDDSLDVFPVHGVGGILGTLLCGVFASKELGVFSGWGFGAGNTTIAEQVTVQAIGVLSTGIYAGLVSWVLLVGLDKMVGIRVTGDEETEGLDIAMHEERGYYL